MRYQELIGEETKAAFDEFFKYARAVPEDKREWSPLDNGRTVLAQARECAKCPDWAVAIVSSDEPPKWDEESMAANQAEMGSWKTLEECETEGRKRLEKMVEAFAGLSDEQLEKKKWLPFDGGREFTYREMTTYPRWNFNYHTGQVAYVQTLYGDKEMH